MINFLKGEFRFDSDPYEAWFVWSGRRETVTFSGLLDLKILRNQLVHEEPRDVEITERDSVDSDTYYRGRLMLSAVAHSISDSIVNRRYKVN